MNPAPRWEVPGRYGYAAAIESMGSVAAPLLAGVSLALVALVIQGADAFRWPNAALGLFVLAALSLVAAVQATFHARQFVVTPPELEMWWSNPDHPERREQLRREQRYYLSQHELWAGRARRLYRLGILSLLLGLVAVVVPVGPLSDADAGRLIVLALAAFGFCTEAAWIGLRYLRPKEDHWPPSPGPEIGN